MWKYIIKRILIFIPTLIIISLLTFWLSTNAPGDPVEQMLGGIMGSEGRTTDFMATEQAYMEQRKKLGLDLPLFYIALQPLSVPDTFYRIPRKKHQEVLRRLIAQLGNWEYIQAYYLKLKDVQRLLYGLPSQGPFRKYRGKAYELINELFLTYDTMKIGFYTTLLAMTADSFVYEFSKLSMDTNLVGNSERDKAAIEEFKKAVYELRAAYLDMINNPETWKNYIPTIHWYGTKNQYHRWISGFIVGDFGISYVDKRPVAEVIKDAVKWTALINLISVILIYLIAIQAGVYSAVKAGTFQDQVLTVTLYILYSLPNFWIATLLIMFFGGGAYLDWFPAFGVSSLPETAPLWQRIIDVAHHLILPVLALTYPSLAFLAKQMRGAMIQVLKEDYIRTAYAKGLPDKVVIWKHAFRNSLLPIITLFANVFPFMISGSFVIEYIFSIPGMGKESYEAIMSRNYPVVYTVVMLVSILTLVGYLVADILYALVDPRISYSKKK